MEQTIIMESIDPSAVEISMENLIKNSFQRIEQLKKEIKDQRDLVTNSYESNAGYHDSDELAKSARKKATEIKKNILSANIANTDKLKDLRTELKELKDSLSSYLVEYQKTTQVTQMELFDGEIYEIKLTGNLRKSTNIER